MAYPYQVSNLMIAYLPAVFNRHPGILRYCLEDDRWFEPRNNCAAADKRVILCVLDVQFHKVQSLKSSRSAKLFDESVGTEIVLLPPMFHSTRAETGPLLTSRTAVPS